ncbi:MAG TPA: hypothetical protein VEW07_11420 [Solirubrobacterales bacterium]|nr:hypothetical protein [Solirubrobacterales bacterium]
MAQTKTAPHGAADKHVHRELTRGKAGPDVKQLQHGIDHKAATWKLEQFTVEVDGEYGKETERAAEHLLYAMGVGGMTLRRARKGELSEYAQRLLRGSRPRTTAMKALAKVRKPRVQKWRRGNLRERAYKVADSCVGIMEEGGNNTGKMVDKIILANGGVIGEPWCGDGMAFCYRLAGSKAVTRAWAAVALFLGVLGIRRTSSPQRGDLVRFTFDHIGMFVKDLGNGEIESIEFNTGPSGAVSDGDGGDGVYRKRRDKSLVNDYLRVTR